MSEQNREINAEKRSRMEYLAGILNKASEAYYTRDTEIMSNLEYDALYDELRALEEETGFVMAGSPTVRVGYAVADELPRVRHEKRMLSLDKTKSREDLAAWLGEQTGLLSWKLDGLTVVLTYEEGRLAQAVTRGDGQIGEEITANAAAFKNIPAVIPFKGRLTLRGEAVIRYSDFAQINEEIAAEAAAKGQLEDVRYKNPRNLCSGSVRQLDSAVTSKRRVRFYAFTLVEAAEGEKAPDFRNSRLAQLRFLQAQGFETVETEVVGRNTVAEAVGRFEQKIAGFDIPSDGLVLVLDDIAYGESLGTTAKFPRNAIAFKWADEQQTTTLLEVEWSASRTGLINPVAVFEPVELEGTTVRRASVHNVSIVRALQLGIGDRLMVYKANMIIPQIAENLTRSGTLEIPAACPVCGGKTEIRRETDTEVLVCTNPECPAKKIKAFTLFTSRTAMNIEGLSEMTLEKFIAEGFIHEFADIYHLDDHRDAIVKKEGFGEKSYARLTESIEKSRNTTLPRLLYALGITGIGAANARVLCDHFGDDLEAICAASAEELGQVEGIGPVLAAAVSDWFSNEKNRAMLDRLMNEVHPAKRRIRSFASFKAANTKPADSTAAGAGLSDSVAAGAGPAGSGAGSIHPADVGPAASGIADAGLSGSAPADGSPAGAGAADFDTAESDAADPIAGKTFVVTGKVAHFANRDALKEYIADRGGKVAGSVSAKTDYLINNDVTSTSSKNKKASQLGIPILSEEDFLRLAGER
ncbi:MAG: NAD-dependent DNA ligase LigA [Eubacteriales bacterium]|nr:NAD-dependent DNA ligase LigA [Eubacteriales bacterium]